MPRAGYVVALGMLTLSLGCEAGDGELVKATRLPVRAVSSGATTFHIRPYQKTATSIELWRAAWADLQPHEPLPEVDFAREVAVVAGLETGRCHRLAVRSALRTGNLVTVQVVERRLGRDCACPAVALTPFVAVAVPAAGATVVVGVERVTEPCP